MRLTNSGSDVGLIVTQSKNKQVGAIWSQSPIFDLSKQSQSMSANILFQPPATGKPGDGMAFVLTADKQTKVGYDGGALGVWGGPDTSPTKPTSAQIAANAIQHSAAIAFDTYADTDTYDGTAGYGNSSVFPAPSQYVGFGYPGLPDMYQIFTSGGKSTPALSFTNKNSGSTTSGLSFPGAAPNTLAQLTTSKWHILEVNWQRNYKDGGTLTYKISDADEAGKHNAIVQSIQWSQADINTIFGSNSPKLYVGFTGTTGDAVQDNVLAFRSLPGIVNAAGTVKVTRPADSTTVTDKTVLHTNDALNYHVSLTYDASSSQSWPANSANKLVMYLPKSKYLIASQRTISVTGSDGSSATVNLDSSSATQFKLSGFDNFLKGTSKTITFDIPVNVDATVDNNTIPVGSTQSFSDNTATMVGDDAQIQVSNPDQTSDPYTIKYQIQNTGKPFVPPALPDLETVPDLHFINTARGLALGPAKANPTVSEFIRGAYTRSDDVQQSANDTSTSNPQKLPYISSSDNLNKIINPSVYDPTGPQLLSAAYKDLTGQTYSSLVINGNKTQSNWNLGLQLSQFKTTDAKEKTLPRPARIVFVSLSGIGKGLPASYLPKPTDATHPAVVTDGASAPTTIMSDSTAQSMKSMGSNTSGDGGFKSGALMGFLYFDQSLPTIQAGSYTAQATWTLSTTP
ncbi:hypothetical protein IV56_GL000584 [Lacticaseibacillus saniviri JCM 17471 = DSM 24301]|uniref:WxL domain-containing protein n=1 Tax=Lacticaseibacillus saniviri JCM 17471 = DSM 24301 TaxID=1293598 RepID=A0A0R2MTR0_9LACO|nr:hypothetical protein IV56_GL000584 [Lacticaseibacillus saniviri JCM 17471 = DSM 24301]